MPSPRERHLEAQLASVMHRIRCIRQCNLSVESERERALEESLEVLRTLAVYRSLLKNLEETDLAAVPSL